MAQKRNKADRTVEGGNTSNCPYSRRCGACAYIEQDYAAQLCIKQRHCEDLLKAYGRVERIVPMENPYHYRNKIAYAFAYQKGQVLAGPYEKNSHRVVDIRSCRIEDELGEKILASMRLLVKSFKMKIYDEDTGYGFLRHILIRVGKNTGELMLVLVTGTAAFAGKNNFVKVIRALHPEITTIIQNINGASTSMILGDKEYVLYGPGYIEDVLCGLRFRISSKSFYQVNPVQTQKLYTAALEMADLQADMQILDAYSGVGTIGLIAAAKVKKVISVELNRDAVKDAVYNARRNRIKNVDFYRADAAEFVRQLAQEGGQADVLLMDPPRSGSTPVFIAAVLRLAPRRVVYISCNPESLARDLRQFTSGGYRVERILPFDCFAMTEHVECVILLSKVQNDAYTNI